MFGLNKISKMWSQDMAIDLGTANTLVVLKSQGVVLKGIGLYCSVQLFGMQKLLLDSNFKPRAFLRSPGPPLLVGGSILPKSL